MTKSPKNQEHEACHFAVFILKTESPKLKDYQVYGKKLLLTLTLKIPTNKTKPPAVREPPSIDYKHHFIHKML